MVTWLHCNHGGCYAVHRVAHYRGYKYTCSYVGPLPLFHPVPILPVIQTLVWLIIIEVVLWVSCCHGNLDNSAYYVTVDPKKGCLGGASLYTGAKDSTF